MIGNAKRVPSAAVPMPALVLTIDLPVSFYGQIARTLHPIVVRDEVPSAVRDIGILVRIPAQFDPDWTARLDAIRHHATFASVTGVYLEQYSNLRTVAPLRQHGLQEVVTADVLEQPDALRATLARAHRASESDYIWRCSALDVPEPAARILRAALQQAHHPVAMPCLASCLRMHERSVRKFCAQHGLPSPQWLIGWARVLTAAHYLDTGSHSIKETALMMGFTSPSQLANLLRRYTGRTAGALMQDGALQTAARFAESAITTTRSQR